MIKNAFSTKKLTIQMYSFLEQFDIITVKGIPYYFVNFDRKMKNDDWGGFSHYYRVKPRLGIKVFSQQYVRLGNLARSRTLAEAKEEVSILSVAASSGFTPRMAMEIIVKHKGKYCAAIIMEHIIGEPLCNITGEEETDPSLYTATYSGKLLKNDNGYQIEPFLIERLKNKTRVNHLDLHSGNIIVGPNKKLYVIDFSPDYCKMVRKK